jgi:hypothetical protein
VQCPRELGNLDSLEVGGDLEQEFDEEGGEPCGVYEACPRGLLASQDFLSTLNPFPERVRGAIDVLLKAANEYIIIG